MSALAVTLAFKSGRDPLPVPADMLAATCIQITGGGWTEEQTAEAMRAQEVVSRGGTYDTARYILIGKVYDETSD